VITPATRPTNTKTYVRAISSRVFRQWDVDVAVMSRPLSCDRLSVEIDTRPLSHWEHGTPQLVTGVNPLIARQM